jgi:hypothetical protein
MIDDTRPAAGRARASTTGRPRSNASAGLPAEDLTAEERLSELDARLARLEGGPGYRERGRHLLSRIMPPEAGRHFRNAGREELLGIRSIVDFWIDRIDAAENRATTGTGRAERIDVG